MTERYENSISKVKKGAYKLGEAFLIGTLLSTGVFAQEELKIDNNKLNEEISKPTTISYTIKGEQKSLEDISNEINQNVKEQRENVFKIGQWEGYKQTINGVDYYFVDGLDCPFLKYEIKSDSPPTFIAIANHAIKHGLEEALSAMGYDEKDIRFCQESIEQKKDEKDVYFAYVKVKKNKLRRNKNGKYK